MIGIQKIIWDRTAGIANLSGEKAEHYPGPHPHHDHVHVEIEIDKDGAAMTTPSPSAVKAPCTVAPLIDGRRRDHSNLNV